LAFKPSSSKGFPAFQPPNLPASFYELQAISYNDDSWWLSMTPLRSASFRLRFTSYAGTSRRGKQVVPENDQASFWPVAPQLPGSVDGQNFFVSCHGSKRFGGQEPTLDKSPRQAGRGGACWRELQNLFDDWTDSQVIYIFMDFPVST
jgi:hypothetical protein